MCIRDRLEKTVDLPHLLNESSKSSVFDITSLPILDINETNPLHDTIKSQIDKLPVNESLTFTFEDLDLTIDEVQVYSSVAYLIMLIIVIVNSILIGIIYLKKWRRIDRNDRDNSFKRSSGFLNNVGRDSITKLKSRLYGMRKRISNPSSLRSSLRSSIRGTKKRVKKRSRSATKKIENLRLSRKRSKSPYNINPTSEVGTNTYALYPNISSIDSTPESKRKVAALKAYR